MTQHKQTPNKAGEKKQTFHATLKEAKDTCRSYYEPSGQLRGCTCGTCLTTPSTEMLTEMEAEFKKACEEKLFFPYGGDDYDFDKEKCLSFIRKWMDKAEKAGVEKGKIEAKHRDKKRLDFLDQLNRGLNKYYGTKYGWEMITNHNVTRIFSGNVSRIDLNDAAVNGFDTCREAIDAKMKEITNTK